MAMEQDGGLATGNSYQTLVSPCPPTIPQEQKRPLPKPRQRMIHLQHWAWEAINTVLLITMIAAVVVTLHLHDGQPAPDWPLSITINALISIYAFVFKGSMAFILTSSIGQFQWSWYRSPRSLRDISLYEDAGRGPLGSFVLLCLHRLRQPVVALAALMTVVGIALDPFFQQLVQSVSCSAPLLGGTRPSVPRTNFLDQEELPYSLQPTVISGFYQARNLSDIECPTGNCTFSTSYSSLGFCSQCDDVSKDVVIQEHCIVSKELAQVYEKGPCDAEGDNSTVSWNLTTSAYPFSTNFYLHQYNLTTGDDGLLVFDTPTVFSVQGMWQKVNVLEYNTTTTARSGVEIGILFPLAETAIFRVEPANWNNPLSGCSDARTNDTWYCRGYGAAKCLLQPCVRTYTASVNAGHVDEVIVDQSEPTLTWGYSAVVHNTTGGLVVSKQFWGLLDKTCITEQERVQLTAAGYDMREDSRWLPYNITFDPPDTIPEDASSFPESLLAHKCIYIIDSVFLEKLWAESLSNMLLGKVNRTADFQSHPIQINTFSGSQQLLYMFNSGNVDMTRINSVFDNLAQALTLWTRTNGATNYSERSTGEVFHLVSCIQVNWVWLALPVALALSTLVLLVLTIAATSWWSLPGWKSSSFALLLRGPAGSGWIDESLVAPTPPKTKEYDLRTVSGMNKLADKIWVTLVYENQGPRLHQVQADPRPSSKN